MQSCSRCSNVMEVLHRRNSEIEEANKKARNALSSLLQGTVWRSSARRNLVWPERCPSQSIDLDMAETQTKPFQCYCSALDGRRKPRFKITPRWPVERPPGVRKNGRILEIQRHGRWERLLPAVERMLRNKNGAGCARNPGAKREEG